MGWVIGRNRSIQHKSGRRVDCWGAALVVMGWVAPYTMGSALRHRIHTPPGLPAGEHEALATCPPGPDPRSPHGPVPSRELHTSPAKSAAGNSQLTLRPR